MSARERGKLDALSGVAREFSAPPAYNKAYDEYTRRKLNGESVKSMLADQTKPGVSIGTVILFILLFLVVFGPALLLAVGLSGSNNNTAVVVPSATTTVVPGPSPISPSAPFPRLPTQEETRPWFGPR